MMFFAANGGTLLPSQAIGPTTVSNLVDAIDLTTALLSPTSEVRFITSTATSNNECTNPIGCVHCLPDSWELRGLAHYRVGTALLFLGDHITAADHLRKSVATLDHEAGRTLLRFGGLVLAFSASFAAWALAELGEFVEAETVGQMGFDLAVRANHAYSMGVASFGLSHAPLRRGHLADAINVLERGYEQIKLHSVEAVFDQVVSRLCYAYAKAGRSEEARAIGSEIAHFSFLSSTHFLLAAIGIQSDRIELTLRQAREAHETANSRGERGIVAWIE